MNNPDESEAMTNKAESEAKGYIETLLSVLGIKRIVYVDDIFAIRVEDVIGCFKTLSPTQRTRFGQFRSILSDPNIDDDILGQRVSQQWENMDAPNRKKTFLRLKLEVGIDPTNDFANAHVLTRLINKDLLTLISFQEWQEQQGDLLMQAKLQKTLFLFDQDMSKEEGGSPKEGMRIIQQLLHTGNDVVFVCALLTHEVRAESVYEYYMENIDQCGLEEHKGRFCVIAKELLSDNPVDFSRSLKLTVLSDSCDRLISTMHSIFQDTSGKAQDEIKKINIFQFEEVVINSSVEEGIWESETLFRLFALHQRQEALHQMLTSDEIRCFATMLRQVREIPNPTNQKTTGAALWKLKRLEHYRDAEPLNQLHTPIELGDVFEGKAPDERYVLLAQPCDLMVRNSGARGHLTEVVLAPIRQCGSNVDAAAAQNPTAYGELKYFDDDTYESRYLNFGKTELVKLDILDLCVFNSDGVCRFTTINTSPHNLLPGWEKRYERLHKDFKRSLELHNKLSEMTEVPDLLDLAVPKAAVNSTDAFPCEVLPHNAGFEFKCKRIGRVLQPYATDLYQGFLHHCARSALEHDFAKKQQRVANNSGDTVCEFTSA